jgi:hypothetical protein
MKTNNESVKSHHTYIRQNRLKMITTDKEGHYIIKNVSIHEENITSIHRHLPNTKEPK